MSSDAAPEPRREARLPSRGRARALAGDRLGGPGGQPDPRRPRGRGDRDRVDPARQPDALELPQPAPALPAGPVRRALQGPRPERGLLEPQRALQLLEAQSQEHHAGHRAARRHRAAARSGARIGRLHREQRRGRRREVRAGLPAARRAQSADHPGALPPASGRPAPTADSRASPPRWTRSAATPTCAAIATAIPPSRPASRTATPTPASMSPSPSRRRCSRASARVEGR